jgi:hypothetical protein
MERRNFKRISLGEKAEIIVNNKSIQGVIENLSEAGANIIAGPVGDVSGFVPDAEMELKIRPLDDETIVLNGTIQWIQKVHPSGQIYKIGILLTDPPWDESSFFI